MNKVNPIGLIGRFIPEEKDEAWSKYINEYCTIIGATFFSPFSGELEVVFMDGVELIIQLEEFALV